jgi:26S proteasome non-ATPase regulatory subunit 10
LLQNLPNGFFLIPFNSFDWSCRGASLDTNDEDGWTPLLSACSAGQTSIVRLLVSSPGKVDVNHRNNSGASALHYACSKGHLEIVKLLIESGANVNQKDKYGGTPLHRVASNTNVKTRASNEPIIDLLLNNGVDINVQDGNGDTPLHAACVQGNRKAAEKLIMAGAQVVDNDDKKLPFELCEDRSTAEALINLAKQYRK